MRTVLVQQAAADAWLETRLSDDGLVRYVAVVLASGKSTRDLHLAVERAREVFALWPEPIGHVELKVSRRQARKLRLV